MKLLSNDIAVSTLGAIALMCIGGIVAVMPALISGNGAASGGVVLEAVISFLFFPFMLLEVFDPGMGVGLLLACFALAVTLAFWTSVIHGLRLLLRT